MGREGIWKALEEGKSTIKIYLTLKIVLSNKKYNKKERKEDNEGASGVSFR